MKLGQQQVVRTCEGRQAERPRLPPNAIKDAAERYEGSRAGVGATAAVYIYATAVSKLSGQHEQDQSIKVSELITRAPADHGAPD